MVHKLKQQVKITINWQCAQMHPNLVQYLLCLTLDDFTSLWQGTVSKWVKILLIACSTRIPGIKLE